MEFLNWSDWPFASPFPNLVAVWKREQRPCHSTQFKKLLDVRFQFAADVNAQLESMQRDLWTIQEIVRDWPRDSGYFHECWKSFAQRNPELSHLLDKPDVVLTDTQRWRLRVHILAWSQKWTFNNLPSDTRAALTKKFQSIKETAYLRIVQAEAERQGCSIEDVDPRQYSIAKVVKASESQEFVNCPEHLLYFVLNKLDVVDVVSVACTCKKWRNIGLQYMRDMKTAEHPLTTHLLKRRKWLQPDASFSGKQQIDSWRRTGERMAKWMGNVCHKLETLIMPCPLSSTALTAVLQGCPCLKNLVAGIMVPETETDSLSFDLLDFKACRLECLILMASEPNGARSHRSINSEALYNISLPDTLSVVSLAPGIGHHENTIASNYGEFCASFFNDHANQLIALEETIWPEIELRDLDELQILRLRYLRLRVGNVFCGFDDLMLSALLQQCPELCVLLLDDLVPVSDSVLGTILQFCPQLEVAWLVNNHEIERFKPETLKELDTSFTKRGRDLNNFCIVASEQEIPALKEAAPSMTYIAESYQSNVPLRFSLSHRHMRRRLGLKF